MVTLFLIKEARIYNGEKTASSISGAGKTGQLHAENEIRTLPKIIHKNKLKMDSRPKYKTRHYKILEENIDRTLYDINHSKILFDPPPREMEIKTKFKNGT